MVETCERQLKRRHKPQQTRKGGWRININNSITTEVGERKDEMADRMEGFLGRVTVGN